MSWLGISLASWRARTLRSVVSACGVGIAVGALCSLVSFSRGYSRAIRSELENLGGHILLVPKGCPYDAASMALHGASWPCYLKQDYLREVLSVQGVTAAPVFMTALPLTNSAQAVYLGVDTNILALKRAWRISGAFPQNGHSILAGAALASRERWQTGATIRLPGMPNRSALVSGILAPTGSPDDDFIFLPLAAAQECFHHSNELTHILVRLSDPEQMSQVVSQLRGCDAGLAMNVVPLAHVFQTIQSVVGSTRFLLGCVALVGLFIAATGVGNTVLISVFERTREIGVMRALGASRLQIFLLVWGETLQVCLLGALLGQIAVAAAGAWGDSWTRSHLPFAPAGPLFYWEWRLSGIAFGCAVALGTIAAWPAAWRAARLPPVVAIRSANAL